MGEKDYFFMIIIIIGDPRAKSRDVSLVHWVACAGWTNCKTRLVGLVPPVGLTNQAAMI